MDEKKKPSKRTIRRGIAVLVILLVMLVCILMITLLLVFQIRKIKVKGNTYLTSGEIQNWIEQDDAFGNSLYLMYKVHFTDFELLPTMEDAKIKMVIRGPFRLMLQKRRQLVILLCRTKNVCILMRRDGCLPRPQNGGIMFQEWMESA